MCNKCTNKIIYIIYIIYYNKIFFMLSFTLILFLSFEMHGEEMFYI